MSLLLTLASSLEKTRIGFRAASELGGPGSDPGDMVIKWETWGKWFSFSVPPGPCR